MDDKVYLFLWGWGGGDGIRIQNTITLLVILNTYSVKRFGMTTTDSVVLQRDPR